MKSCDFTFTVDELPMIFTGFVSDTSLSAAPTTSPSQVQGLLTPEEELKVAQQIAGSWSTLALYLSPEVFTMDKINEIQQGYRPSLIQAKAMIEKWSNQFHKHATRRVMMSALCKAGQRRQASLVFGDSLVDLAVPGNS